MENKNVGYILLGVSVIIILIIFMFKSALTGFVDSSCTLAHGGNYCPMYDTITQQTYLALAIVGILIIVSIVLILSRQSERIIVKTKTVEKKQEKKNIDTSDLTKEEKQVFNIITQNKTIFQAELIEKTSFNKAKITRIIDRLEGKGLVNRIRRGMTNVVALKE